MKYFEKFKAEYKELKPIEKTYFILFLIGCLLAIVGEIISIITMTAFGVALVFANGIGFFIVHSHKLYKQKMMDNKGGIK